MTEHLQGAFAIAHPAVLAIATLFFGCTTPGPDKDLNYWLQRHTEARGGRAAIEAIRAVEIELQIEEPKFKVNGRYVGTRDGQMRIDVFADGKRVFTEALDGARGWQWGEGESAATEASPRGTVAIQHGIEFPFKVFGLHEAAARGHRLALLEPETVGGIDYAVVELTLTDGFQVRYYFDPTTALIALERQKRTQHVFDPTTALIALERQKRAQHVDLDATEQWIETRYYDYRAVNGVRYPFLHTETEVRSGKFLSRGIVLSMRANPSVDPQFFEMTAATAR